MLEQRVSITNNIFRVIRERNATRQLYYILFDLAENPDHIKDMKEILYWDGVSNENILDVHKETCVRILEKEKNQIVEYYDFYYSPNEERGTLILSKKKASKAYGSNAYLITIEWVEHSEPINSQFIYLKNREGERFHFLCETIEAMNPESKKLQDKYITRLPENHSIDDYSLEVAPLVEQKYIVLKD